jgi:hypothetical protein
MITAQKACDDVRDAAIPNSFSPALGTCAAGTRVGRAAASLPTSSKGARSLETRMTCAWIVSDCGTGDEQRQRPLRESTE